MTAVEMPASQRLPRNSTAKQWVERLQNLMWPIVFLSWLPFISSNMILQDTLTSGFPPDMIVNLMQVFPGYSWPVIVVMLALGLAAVIAKRQPSSLLALLPLFALLYFSSALASQLAEADLPAALLPDAPPLNTNQLAVFSFAYSLTVVISMAFFCYAGRIHDSFFRLFYFVAFVDCLLASAGIEFAFYGLILENYWPSIIGVCLSLMAVFVGRSAVLAVRQNQGIRQKFSGELAPALKKAFLLWWPMLAFFAGMTGIYFYIDRQHVTPAIVSYLNGFEQFEAGPDGGPKYEAPPPLPDPPPATIEGALKALIDRKAAETTVATDQAIAASSRQISAGSKETRDNARQSVEGALPGRFPGTETRSCGWLDVACLLTNGVKSMANSAYQRAKKRQMDQMQAQLDRLYAREEASNAAIAAEFTGIARAQIAATASTSKTAIHQIARTLLLLGYVLAAYSILVLLKSFLVVFARVLYSKHTFSHGADSTEDIFGKISIHGDTFSVPKNSPKKYYVKQRAIGVNIVERKRIPYWHKVPFIRLFTASYVLCYIDTTEDFQGACDIKVDPPAELVAWELRQGEEVFLSFSDFVAISEETRLASRISLQLSSLIFGRIIYHYVVGPGTLILRTKSSAIAGKDPKAEHSLNASGLVAWNARNEFNVVSNLSIVDTFFSGCSLRKTKGDLIVYDTSRDRITGGVLGGIWKTGRTFLLPF